MNEEKTTTKYAAFAIIERINQKPRWLRLGPAFLNGDGSFTAMCNVIPVETFSTGQLKINVREDKPKEEQEMPF